METPRGKESGSRAQVAASPGAPCSERDTRPSSRAPLRASSYTVRVATHERGRTLLVHGYTGAIDLVDEATLALLDRSRERVPEGAPAGAVEALRNRGFLTKLSDGEEIQRVETMLAVLYRKRTRFHSFTFVPTYDCNLRCPYCYQQHLSTRGRAWIETKVDRRRIDAAFELMGAVAGPSRSWINLYGGEPFLARNLAEVSYFLDRAFAEGYRVHAISNGTEIHHFLDHFGPGRIRSIQITLDGPPEIHDRRRAFEDGSPSFRAIARNVRDLLDRGVEVRIRVNLDATNLEGIPALRRVLGGLGLGSAPGLSVHFYPVRSCGSPTIDARFERGGLAEQVDRLADRETDTSALEGNHAYQHIEEWFLEALEHGRPMRFVGIACDASTTMSVLDPHGGIFPCWDVVGRPEEMIGTYYPKIEWREAALKRWRDRTPLRMPACLRCPYVMFCGGGCTWQAGSVHGDILAPTCGDTGFKPLFRRHVAKAYLRFNDADRTPLQGSFGASAAGTEVPGEPVKGGAAILGSDH